MSVFVEEVSAKDPKNVIGRTNQDKKVVFEGTADLIGSFHKVKLTDIKNETFVGKKL